MRKLSFGLLSLLCVANIHASHLQDINASNISQGTLDSARLNASSVTMLGPSIRDFVPRHYDVTIGTLNSLGVDIASSSEDGLIEAVRRLGGNGLGAGTSIYGTIYVRSGIYTLSAGATIPQNVSLFCAPGSSTIFNLGALGNNMLTIYGLVEGCTFSASGLAFANTLLDVKSNATLRKVKLMGGENKGNIIGSTMVKISSSFNVNCEGVSFNGYLARAGVSDAGDNAIMDIRGSSNVFFTNVNFTSHSQVNNAGDGIRVMGSTRVVFNGGQWDVGGRFLVIGGGGRDVEVAGVRFRFVNENDGSGYITTFTQAAPYNQNISSSVYIHDCSFIQDTVGPTGASNLAVINLRNDGTVKGIGSIIENNFVTSLQPTNFTFLTVGASAIGTVACNNHVIDGSGAVITFLSDSGDQTKSASCGNFKNYAQQ